LKKPTGSVRFWFYKPETEKTKPNPYKKKPIQTEKPSKTSFCFKKPKLVGLNRFFFLKNRTEPKPGHTSFFHKKSNRTETGRFEPVSLKKYFNLIIFFYKN
jgi:hypothetical protein